MIKLIIIFNIVIKHEIRIGLYTKIITDINISKQTFTLYVPKWF